MAGDRNFSYWEKDSLLQPSDLIVVGAGIVGLSAALFFKELNPESRVLVLDKGMIPEGASTRNAGFACVGSITEHVADMEKESEEGIQKRIIRRYRGLNMLRDTLGDEAIGYSPCGGYELFTSHESFGEAAGYIDRFNQWMQELLGEDKVYRADTLNGYPVIYNRLEGALHPGKMMQQLISKAGKAGIGIRWNSPVARLNREGGVQLNDGLTVPGKQTLMATNGFTRRLMPELDIRPARGYVMVTAEWEDLPWKGTFHYDRGYIYFRNIGQRLLLGGARNISAEEEEVDVFGINASIKEHLMSFARQRLHLPEYVNVEYEWSGIMGFTSTKTPVIRRIGPALVVAAGLSGMGVAIGTEVGNEAAKLLSSP